MKPIIGITANYMSDGSAEYQEGIGAPGQAWQKLAHDYITAVEQAGGLPLILPIVSGEDAAKELLERVDGVLFSGGSDIDPLLFGETATGKNGNIIPERDRQEAFMLRHLLDHTRKPVLGVCRGIQLMNAALGGTLIQHIPDEGFTSHSLSMYPRQSPSHRVTVVPGSLLYRITGQSSLAVNSFHHMAVKQCAPRLTVTGRAEDGVIEAMELADNPGGRFFLGVQWHPEMMVQAAPAQQAILTAFVEHCKY